MSWDSYRKCWRKVKFETEAEARAALEATKQIDNQPDKVLQIYMCIRYCKRWHIGHRAPTIYDEAPKHE